MLIPLQPAALEVALAGISTGWVAHGSSSRTESGARAAAAMTTSMLVMPTSSASRRVDAGCGGG